jgi:hypothetical protein
MNGEQKSWERFEKVDCRIRFALAGSPPRPTSARRGYGDVKFWNGIVLFRDLTELGPPQPQAFSWGLAGYFRTSHPTLPWPPSFGNIHFSPKRAINKRQESPKGRARISPGPLHRWVRMQMERRFERKMLQQGRFLLLKSVRIPSWQDRARSMSVPTPLGEEASSLQVIDWRAPPGQRRPGRFAWRRQKFHL